jgi:hypothetical protein
MRIEISHDKSQQLGYTPASFKVLKHHRVKFAYRKFQAPAPPKPIEIAARAWPFSSCGVGEVWRPSATVLAGRYCGPHVRLSVG